MAHAEGAFHEIPLTTPSRTVLVVADEPTIREILQLVLEEERFLVKTSSAGPEARAFLAPSRPALVVMTLAPTGCNGHAGDETLLAAERAALPLLILSTSPQVVAQVRADAKHHALCMPFALDDLIAAVDRALGGARPGRSGVPAPPRVATSPERLGSMVSESRRRWRGWLPPSTRQSPPARSAAR